MAQNWVFREDYLVCKFYLDHVDSWKEHIDELMTQLMIVGFGTRKKDSVIMRIQNCAYLHTDKGLSNVSKQTRKIYDLLVRSKSNQAFQGQLQNYIQEKQSRGNIETTEDIFSQEQSLVPLSIDILAIPKNIYHFIYEGPRGPSFQSVLFKFIDGRGMKDAEVYNACFVGKDTFSAIRCGKNKGVSKRTVMQLCFGLKLTYDEAVVLMASAGYAFSDCILTDIIIAYYLKNKNYDIFDVNATLFENNADLLFSA